MVALFSFTNRGFHFLLVSWSLPELEIYSDVKCMCAYLCTLFIAGSKHHPVYGLDFWPSLRGNSTFSIML